MPSISIAAVAVALLLGLAVLATQVERAHRYHVLARAAGMRRGSRKKIA